MNEYICKSLFHKKLQSIRQNTDITSVNVCDKTERIMCYLKISSLCHRKQKHRGYLVWCHRMCARSIQSYEQPNLLKSHRYYQLLITCSRVKKCLCLRIVIVCIVSLQSRPGSILLPQCFSFFTEEREWSTLSFSLTVFVL